MYTQFPAHIHPKDKTVVQSCEEHSRNAARHAAHALESIGFNSSAYLAGLLHDLGKYKPQFKAYIEASDDNQSSRRGSVIHTFAGTSYLLRYHKQNADLDFSYEDMLLRCYTRTEFDLVDFGNPQTWDTVFDKVTNLIETQNIDIFRQDANIDPLLYWEYNDEAGTSMVIEYAEVP